MCNNTNTITKYPTTPQVCRYTALWNDISHGSAATHLRCGGIFSDSIITHFLLILTVNIFENRLMFDEVTAYQKTAIFVWATL